MRLRIILVIKKETMPSTTASAALLAGAALSALLAYSAPAHAQAGASDPGMVDQVVVTGAATRTSAVTGLDLSLKETPQSVSVIGQRRIADFALTDVNQLLAQAPGVNVEQVETDRTYYNARGFDITNFQVDGVGLPLIWGIQFGGLDTALFERVEVVRGANSMMTGTGNPSATVNYVRKRPTRMFQASASALYGSWDDKRLELDVSGPLNATGSVSGRLIYANEDKDSYLDHYGVNRNVYAALLSWDMGERASATVGYSLQDNRARGVLWGALPINYADGSLVDYPASASTSADWTYWNVRDQTTFAEVVYRLGGGWELKGVGTYKRFEEHAKLLYAYDNPDPTTGLGVLGMSGIYPSNYDSYIFDAYASGPFDLFGRTHQLVLGGQASRSTGVEYEDFFAGELAYPAVQLWGREQVAEPAYPGAYLAARQVDRLYRFYAATHLSLSDRLKVVAGFNAMKLRSTGFSYGTDTARDAKKVSPYFGAVYDLTPQVSVYASYTDIFNPQSEVDQDHRTLDPAHGKSYEAGVKANLLGERLFATAAAFRGRQDGLAEFAGAFPNGDSYYAGIDAVVTGYELELNGRLTRNWSLSGAWTQLKIEDGNGVDVRTYTPRKTLKVATNYTVPDLNNLTFGAALRWQSRVSVQDIVPIEQAPYAVVDLMAGVDLTPHVRATLNLKNAADKKHLTSLMWNQSYYAAPRSVSVRLDYRY